MIWRTSLVSASVEHGRVDEERHRHLDPLARLQGLLLEAEAVHLGEVAADLERRDVVDRAADHGWSLRLTAS